MLEFRGTAANDTLFKDQRHRTSQIVSTVAPIANYPSKLRIYLTNSSVYWQVKCFLKGKTYSKSLRTTSRSVAIRAAKEFFHQKTAEIYGSKIVERLPVNNIKEITFADLVEPTLAIERARSDRGEFSKDSLTILQNRLDNTITPFFGKLPIKSIGYNEIAQFIQVLSKRFGSTITIHQHMVAVRKVLNHAYVNNLIANIPKFPQVKIVSSPRGSYTLGEYRKLVSTARRNTGVSIKNLSVNQKKKGKFNAEKFLTISLELQYLIRFMVNSFVRPSDIKNLQHQHVTVVENEQTYLRLNLPESKKHDKPIVTLRNSVFIYQRLKRLNELRGMAKQTDYVFMPELTDRSTVLIYLGWQFKFIQELAGIEANAMNGKNRTLYSLRHTAITFRLLYGGAIDLLTLARNARTSVDMIEKFYSSNLSAEMNIDLLQGRRR